MYPLLESKSQPLRYTWQRPFDDGLLKICVAARQVDTVRRWSNARSMSSRMSCGGECKPVSADMAQVERCADGRSPCVDGRMDVTSSDDGILTLHDDVRLGFGDGGGSGGGGDDRSER